MVLTLLMTLTSQNHEYVHFKHVGVVYLRGRQEKKQMTGEKESYHVLAHPSDTLNSWDLALSESGAGNSIQSTHVCQEPD